MLMACVENKTQCVTTFYAPSFDSTPPAWGTPQPSGDPDPPGTTHLKLEIFTCHQFVVNVTNLLDRHYLY